MFVKNKSKILPLFAAIFLVAGFLGCQILAGSNFASADDSVKELESKIKKEEAARDKLEQELNSIQSSVNSTRSQIQKIEGLIEQADENIARSKNELELAAKRIDLQKESLKNIIQEAYYNQKIPILFSILNEDSLAKAFSEADSLIIINQRVYDTIEDINKSKIEIENKSKEIEAMKQDQEKILDIKENIQQNLLADKTDTQQDIAEKEATIGELQQKLSELQGDLNQITGNSYNAKDIKEAVEYASKKQGVPKGVLYGFLDQETAMGVNTGQCTYADVEKVSVPGYKKYGKKYKASIDRLYKRWDLFKGIVKDLGYSKNKKVSCTISFAKAGPNQGGAMGVAQFMSDTWLGYEARVAANTGHKKPDPWNLTDGVMAMAIKLRNAGATSDSKLAIRKAVISYYGAFSQSYYNNVVNWSKNYKRLFTD